MPSQDINIKEYERFKAALEKTKDTLPVSQALLQLDEAQGPQAVVDHIKALSKQSDTLVRRGHQLNRRGFLRRALGGVVGVVGAPSLGLSIDGLRRDHHTAKKLIQSDELLAKDAEITAGAGELLAEKIRESRNKADLPKMEKLKMAVTKDLLDEHLETLRQQQFHNEQLSNDNTEKTYRDAAALLTSAALVGISLGLTYKGKLDQENANINYESALLQLDSAMGREARGHGRG